MSRALLVVLATLASSLCACASSADSQRLILRTASAPLERWQTPRSQVANASVPILSCIDLVHAMCEPDHAPSQLSPALVAQRTSACLESSDQDLVRDLEEAVRHCVVTDHRSLQQALLRVMLERKMMSREALAAVPTLQQTTDWIDAQLGESAAFARVRVIAPSCQVLPSTRSDTLRVECEHYVPIACEVDRTGRLVVEHGPDGWRWISLTQGQRISGQECEIM